MVASNIDPLPWQASPTSIMQNQPLDVDFPVKTTPRMIALVNFGTLNSDCSSDVLWGAEWL
jgi:hypothetical protein